MKFDWNKLGSGRLWLTIVAGIVFMYASFHKILEAQAVAAIVTMVFQAYFSRQDRHKEESIQKKENLT